MPIDKEGLPAFDPEQPLDKPTLEQREQAASIVDSTCFSDASIKGSKGSLRLMTTRHFPTTTPTNYKYSIN